jgi:hypothetical protein
MFGERFASPKAKQAGCEGEFQEDKDSKFAFVRV